MGFEPTYGEDITCKPSTLLTNYSGTLRIAEYGRARKDSIIRPLTRDCSIWWHNLSCARIANEFISELNLGMFSMKRWYITPAGPPWTSESNKFINLVISLCDSELEPIWYTFGLTWNNLRRNGVAGEDRHGSWDLRTWEGTEDTILSIVRLNRVLYGFEPSAQFQNKQV